MRQRNVKNKETIINNSYNINFGARPIKRYIQRNIESLIANNIILDKIKINSNIKILNARRG